MARAKSLRKRVWVATRITRLQMWFAVRVLRLYTVIISGREHIPRRGAGIVAARHVSIFDPVVLFGAIRRRRNLAFIAMDKLFKGLKGLVMRWFGHIPVNRDEHESGRSAIAQAQVVLDGGGLVAIFPEGRCSPDGTLLRAKPGIGHLTGAPVIPCWIDGTQQAVPLKGKPKIRQQLVVRFGPPLEKAADETPQAFADRVMVAIAELGGVPAPTVEAA
jgi:1-acyl-sn-glycerol-3-phosphate acyltransferase